MPGQKKHRREKICNFRQWLERFKPHTQRTKLETLDCYSNKKHKRNSLYYERTNDTKSLLLGVGTSSITPSTKIRTPNGTRQKYIGQITQNTIEVPFTEKKYVQLRIRYLLGKTISFGNTGPPLGGTDSTKKRQLLQLQHRTTHFSIITSRIDKSKRDKLMRKNLEPKTVKQMQKLLKNRQHKKGNLIINKIKTKTEPKYKTPCTEKSKQDQTRHQNRKPAKIATNQSGILTVNA